MAEKNKNLIFMGILGLSVLLVIVGIMEDIPIIHPEANQYLILAGVLIQAVLLSRMFWYKNYVQWTKENILIRVKSLVGTSLRFAEIQSMDWGPAQLRIVKSDGKSVLIDLNGIRESDTARLKGILKENARPH